METTIDEHGRPEPPPAADEVATLLGFLDFQRATLEWKTRGLGAEALSLTTAASTITLGGLLKHLGFVESYWFRYRLLGETPGSPWDAVDWEADPDWDWHSAADDSPEDLRSLWESAVEESRQRVARVLMDESPDLLAELPWSNGERPSLRWILVHMIEEYARHNGHADLLREAIDGERGE